MKPLALLPLATLAGCGGPQATGMFLQAPDPALESWAVAEWVYADADGPFTVSMPHHERLYGTFERRPERSMALAFAGPAPAVVASAEARHNFRAEAESPRLRMVCLGDFFVGDYPHGVAECRTSGGETYRLQR